MPGFKFISKEFLHVADSNSQFNADLYQFLLKSGHSNLVYSSMSLSAIMAMLKVGTNGTTEEEIIHGMHFPENNDSLKKGYSDALAYFKCENNLKVVNQIFTSKDYEDLEEDFLKSVKNEFFGNHDGIHFADAEDATQRINRFIKKASDGKIVEFSRPGGMEDILNESTRLILANGVYFKSKWKIPFNDIQSGLFYLNTNISVKVDQLHGTKTATGYTDLKALDAHACSLPLKTSIGELTMIIISSRTLIGLTKIETGLKNFPPSKILEDIEKFMNSEENQNLVIDLAIPRFQIQSTIHLKTAFNELGMKEMFDVQDANLTGIYEHENQEDRFYVSDLIQKVFVEVGQDETIPYDANGSGSSEGITKIVKVVVDSPFFFEIFDRRTNFVMFSGVCVNPTTQ